MSTHNLCFEQKYEKYQSFLSENFQFLEVKFSIYLNRRVYVMYFADTSSFLELSRISRKKKKKTKKKTTFGTSKSCS